MKGGIILFNKQNLVDLLIKETSQVYSDVNNLGQKKKK